MTSTATRSIRSDAGNIGEEWRRNYVRYRLWRRDESILFSYDGDEILERVPHRFGCVPIIRLVDLPKHRTPHIGKSRYEAIAEYQREYYNRDSELILSDTLQAHPILSGAEDFCKAENTLPIGPGYMLPMKKNAEGNGYQGWEFVSPPKDPAESLRKNKQDIVDHEGPPGLLDEARRQPSTGSTTSQSGISKQLDAVSGHKLLASIAKGAGEGRASARRVRRHGPEGQAVGARSSAIRSRSSIRPASSCSPRPR